MGFLSWECQDLEDNLNTFKQSVLSFNHLVCFHIYITIQLQKAIPQYYCNIITYNIITYDIIEGVMSSQLMKRKKKSIEW